MEPTLNF